MEDEQTKTCTNCKRDIPADNFTIHSVHCYRNIRVCPVCKEPVPHAGLDDHYEKLHKLLPCKKCGESICGTDLEDHVRDSCALTVRPCRYCELELPRRELPGHEEYCGTRTETCADCGEWVMIKYRQLHLDSNHGFLKLDDEPGPKPKIEEPIPLRTVNGASVIKVSSSKHNIAFIRQTEQKRANEHIKNMLTKNERSEPRRELAQRPGVSGEACGSAAAPKCTVKRTNDMCQVNTTMVNTNKVEKDLPSSSQSQGATKKRLAPKPPQGAPNRDLTYWSALSRHQEQERQRQEQTAYNLSVGLPPVLNPAAKLEKLRKMDALHNREEKNNDFNVLRGRVWQSAPNCYGNTLGRAEPISQESVEEQREHFNNIKPMTQAEFMDRFKKLQLAKDTAGKNPAAKSNAAGNIGVPTNGDSACGNALVNNPPAPSNDRFSNIKRELRELRRGLNEVTAPYNAVNNAIPYNNTVIPVPPRAAPSPRVTSPPASLSPPTSPSLPASPSPPTSPSPPPVWDLLNVDLPCEFCDTMVPAHNLVQHQTGCRPDLAQYLPSPRRSPPPPLPPRSPSPPYRSPAPPPEPVIPCEFCSESLPVYLVSEHQAQCQGGGVVGLLYPD